MPSTKIYNVKGETIGQAELNAAHFGIKPAANVIHEVVVSQEANKRRGNANTKTRGEVAGGGRKPWKQKGTGRARQGSIRSPQWKGGGITFGPRSERNFEVKINRKIRQKALFMVLSDRVAHEKLFVVDSFPTAEPKTSLFAGWMKKLPFGRKTLVVTAGANPLLMRMVRNLQNVELVSANALHVASVIRFPSVVFEQQALAAFETIYNRA